MTDHTDALLDQAATLHQQGRRQEAIDIFKQVLATRPDSTEGWYELGYLLKAEGRYDEALLAYGEALARGVRRPEEVHLNRAVIYSDNLRDDELARRELTAALELYPDYIPALLNSGNLHEERGEREEALACYDRILLGTQDHGYADLRCEALARSANLRPPRSLDAPLIRQLQEAAAAAVVHQPSVRANVLFALGSAYDRLEAFDPAFDAYAKANRCLLRQSGRPYDRRHAAELTDALIQSFPSATHPTTATPGDGAAPLFICGMFRSGSTLLEQVLGTHPLVTPGGELDFLMRLAARRLAPFPQSMAVPDADREAAFAAEYRAHLESLFPGGHSGVYLTDKRPDNFLLIGLIKRLFPDARIIHTTRNPLDNGLSIFTQHLHHRVAGYSSDLGDIGHHYGQYRRLMAHWKSLYPAAIFDFDYDTFVAEPDASLERLFAFLDLPVHDGHRDFHRLNNTVKTASYWQVREPLHRKASGRWRNYARHLGPLIQALQEAGIETA